MWIVPLDREVVVRKLEHGSDVRIQMHGGKRAGSTAELEPRLVQVIRVEVSVSAREDELAGPQFRNVGNHHGEESVGSNVERYAQAHAAD